jgi:ribonuclease BN (tRNA processing enzyme)
LHPAAVELAEGVDLLIHDAQYTAAELPAKATWGHSAAPYCVNLAHHCGARRVLLFHHDPSRSDAQVDALRDELAATADGLAVDVGREGMAIVL